MKKFLALLLALAMTLALVACGEKKDDTKTDGAGDGEKTYKVAMICDSSINDGGWGAACYNAMIAAAEALGMKLMIGCTTESSCALSAAAQIAPRMDFADLDGNLLIVNDMFDGMKIVDGKITLNDKPGIGAKPRA